MKEPPHDQHRYEETLAKLRAEALPRPDELLHARMSLRDEHGGHLSAELSWPNDAWVERVKAMHPRLPREELQHLSGVSIRWEGELEQVRRSLAVSSQRMAALPDWDSRGTPYVWHHTLNLVARAESLHFECDHVPQSGGFESFVTHEERSDAMGYLASLSHAIRAGEKTFEQAAAELAARPSFTGNLRTAQHLLHLVLQPRASDPSKSES